MWEMFLEIPKIINFNEGTPYGEYIRAKLDTVISEMITKICVCKDICFNEMSLFPHHVSFLMFLISNLSIQWKIKH